MEFRLNIDLGEIGETFKKAKEEIATDIHVIRARDPAAKSDLEVMLLYSGFHAVLAYRLSHSLYERKKFFAARMISQGARFLTGIEIHPGAKIGRGLFIGNRKNRGRSGRDPARGSGAACPRCPPVPDGRLMSAALLPKRPS